MTITHNGKTVELSERDVFAFSFVLGVAKRAEETRLDPNKIAEVKRARTIWTELGVWAGVEP